jgi:hypothetical protein
MRWCSPVDLGQWQGYHPLSLRRWQIGENGIDHNPDRDQEKQSKQVFEDPAHGFSLPGCLFCRRAVV